jgi:hypothetical protein
MSALNHINIDSVFRDVAEPASVAELAYLKDRYVEAIRRKLYLGHQTFIHNLNTFFTQAIDYESFELLFVRRGDLDAEEVLSALNLYQNCAGYLLRDDGPGGQFNLVSLTAAFPKMVREMSNEERGNLFYFGLGCLPLIFKPGMLRIDCSTDSASTHSWSSGSCSGTLYPPKQPPAIHGGIGQNHFSFQTLFSSLKLQSAMDRGSTSGNEFHAI